MDNIQKEDSGWIVALVWLKALEETARDFQGRRPRSFCERAYEHATTNYIKTLENEFGVPAKKTSTIKEAVEEYIRIGVIGGLFQDSSQFELHDINPNRLELTIHLCPYRKICEALLQDGISLKDLTCARIGCFRAAVKMLAERDCTYEITAFDPQKICRGYIEIR